MDWRITSGLFLGWSLGTNDSANVFGTAVATKMIRYRTAIVLCSIFIILGAWFEGAAGFHRLSGLVSQTPDEVFICALGAALTVTFMSYFGLPVSTSQATVGCIIGVGLGSGKTVDISGLGKVVACWIGTPIGGIFLAMFLYKLTTWIISLMDLTFFQVDRFIRWGLIFSGIYGSYALGANNVANVTGVYVGAGVLTVEQAALLGGLSIAIGVLTYSKNVMLTVGKSLIPLNGVGAFVAILAHAIVVHFYAIVGVPVSTSQAIVGSVIGVGIINGRRVRMKTFTKVLQAWLMTPVIAGMSTIIMIRVFLAP